MSGSAFADQAARMAPAARALADESRLRILLLLVERAATVSELSTVLALPQPRVSTHLRLLTEAGLVRSRPSGRFRFYALEIARAEPLLTGLQYAASAGDQHPADSGDKIDRAAGVDPGLRQARRCYDHVAGAFGVRLLDILLERGWLLAVEDPSPQPRYEVSSAGAAALGRLGIDPGSPMGDRRLIAFGCTDWTERRHHLGGRLGRQLATALHRDGVIEIAEDRREVILHRRLTDWLADELND